MMSSIELTLVPDVTAAQQGNVAAYERLVQRCRHSVSSIALAIVKDLDASDEVTQDVFIYIWQQLNTLREPASFLPWVRQMTRYRAFNYLRDDRVKQKIQGEEADDILASFVDPESSVSYAYERNEQSLILREFIDALPDDSREIVLLYYREEQSSQQVADLLGLSEANVRKKLQRVREGLKDKLLDRYGDLIFTTAPTLGFSALIVAAITSSPSAAAATMTSITAATGAAQMATTQGVNTAISGGAHISSQPLGLATMASGAFVGGGLAAGAAYLGMQPALKAADSTQERQALLRLRRHTMIFLGVITVLFVMSYQYTGGWLAPVSVYLLLLAGIATSVLQMYRIITPRLARQRMTDPEEAKRQRRQWWGCAIGSIGGAIAGAIGLMSGLASAGRVMW